MKSSFFKNNFSDFLNSKLFKAILFLLLIMSYLTVSNCKGADVISSISLVFGHRIFVALCLLPIFLFITNYVCTIFDKDIYSIIRFGNKKKYYKELIKNVILFVSTIFLITVMIVVTVENIINDYGYHISYDENFHTYNLIYMIFVIVKFYLFSILFSAINALLIKTFNSKIVIVLNFIFYAAVFYSGNFVPVIESFGNISLFIGNYLVTGVLYKAFWINILANVLMILLLSVLLVILFCYTEKRRRDID